MRLHLKEKWRGFPVMGLFVLLTAACGPGGTDMRPPTDLTMQADLSQVDLMAPVVTGLPTNCTGVVTSAMLYTEVVQGTCATSTSCHAPGSTSPYSIGSAAQIDPTWVGVKSTEAPTMNRVTANNVNQSYVMYKIMGQQTEVAAANMAGARMPRNGPPYLSPMQICDFVQWINGGAQ
jgi:hypothetical protein